jgi:predicted HicB family RNase H-like nuclease
VAGKILQWPDTLLLRPSFVTTISSQRYPTDIRRLLFRYVENNARHSQAVSLVAPLSTRCHDATPGLVHTASLCGVNEYSIHHYRRQCKDFLKTFDRGLPHMQREMKTAQVNLRIHPSLKAAAEKAAEAGHRSLTSLIEKLLADYCKRKGFLK